jgi:hypothetical protein
MVTFDLRSSDPCGLPRGLHQGHNEILTDEGAEQSYVVCQDGGESVLERATFDLSDPLKPLERASLAIFGNGIGEPWELGGCNMKRAVKECGDGGRTEQRM